MLVVDTSLMASLLGIETGLGPPLALVSASPLESVSVEHSVGDADLFGDAVPDHVDAVSVVEAFEDAVAANHDEVEVVLHFEALDVWLAHDHVRVSSVSGSLGFDVSESLRHRQSPWKYSQRPLHIEVFLSWCGGGLGKCLGPVNLAPCCLDSDLLQFVIRLVVSGQNSNLGSSVDGHDGPRVAHIDHVNHLVDHHHHVRTRSRPLRTHILTTHHVLSSSLSLLHQIQEVLLAISEALLDCLDGILRELLVLDHKVVEVVSEVVCTSRSSVAIEDAEEANLGPLDIEMRLVFGFEDIEDDANSVFVVVPDDALVGVGGVGLDDPALLLTGLGGFVVLQLDGLGIQHWRVLSEEQCLDLYELDVGVLVLTG